jgi:hypothetical protein
MPICCGMVRPDGGGTGLGDAAGPRVEDRVSAVADGFAGELVDGDDGADDGAGASACLYSIGGLKAA